MKIAIIGTGISGNALAWLLHRKYDIKLFEKNSYIGGHSNTVEINYDDKKIAVDTGFIVYNHKTYPYLKKLFEILKVKTIASNMSFGITVNMGKLEYCVRNLNGIFSQKKNIFSLRFIKMLIDIFRFNKAAVRFVKNNIDKNDVNLRNISLENFLKDLRVGQYFMDYFLLPMAGAIWSCPPQQMLKYPALSFLRFYYNHGLLSAFDQPQWYTVKGGSKEYVKLITEGFRDEIRTNYKIISVEKIGEKISIKNDKNEEEFYDKVIFANHADEVIEIYKSLPIDALRVLKNFKYQENLAILHRDEKQMPQRKSAWASWIYNKNKDQDMNCSVTYWMNLLQQIDDKYPLFVTLNPVSKIMPEKIFAQFTYHHPIFDEAAINAQSQIKDIQGIDGFYYVGAYQANGFHEDGLVSSVKVAKLFGVEFSDIDN